MVKWTLYLLILGTYSIRADWRGTQRSSSKEEFWLIILLRHHSSGRSLVFVIAMRRFVKSLSRFLDTIEDVFVIKHTLLSFSHDIRLN